MKIGYVTKHFPHKGGAERNIYELATRAVKDGHEVHVFCSDLLDKGKSEKFEEEYEGIKIHRARSWFNFSAYFCFYPAMLRKILKYDLGIIHASGFGFIWQDFVLVVKKLLSKQTKFINTPHGPFMALGNYNIVLKIIKFIYTLIQNLFLNRLYDFVIEVNTFQWRWIMKYGIDKKKIKFIPNGISESIINAKITDAEIEAFKSKYKIGNGLVFSYLGRIDEYKGIQHVVEVLPKMVKQNPDITFLIMGRDEGYSKNLKFKVQKLASSERSEDGLKLEETVRFIENISEREKLIALELSQIFVFPSKWEAFGIVLLEAMSRGNALVSTDTEGGKFLIKEDVNGVLYKYGDTTKLENSLKDLIQNENKRRQMQQANLEKVKGFSWEKIYKNKYLPLLSSAVGK